MEDRLKAFKKCLRGIDKTENDAVFLYKEGRIYTRCFGRTQF